MGGVITKEKDLENTMGLIEGIYFHVLFHFYIFHEWNFMCVLDSFYVISIGFSRCDSVLEAFLAISGLPWCYGVLMFWLSWIFKWI